MGGNITGGRKAAATIRKKYGVDFYKEIGSKGGKLGRTGGFAYPGLCDCFYMRDLHKRAACAGARGGKKSKRGKK